MPPKLVFVLLGSPGVGKTSFLLRLAGEPWIDALPHDLSLGSNFRTRLLEIPRHGSVPLQVWDPLSSTPVACQLPTSRKLYYMADGVWIAFSLTDRASLEACHQWNDYARKNTPETARVMLLGTKSDLSERLVSRVEAETLARSLGAGYVECSAMTGAGVDLAAHQLSRAVLEGKVSDEGCGNMTKSFT
eukprot:TRINITY_DN2142_c0_g1_i2.p1 TRINITY_DN2142_c0_g1~~TRINITY_DN2142_c0_g1_i2.p1  ORF type:complete len:189 (-),score=15.52 TRINITY_DN2142_c0_g1_i2:269-835(-)